MNLGAIEFMKILDLEFEATHNLLNVDDEQVIDELNSSSPVRKINNLASKLKNSEYLRKDFEKFCNTVNLKMSMPKLYIITRWNSTFDMLRWCSNMKQALNILCDNASDNMKTLKLTDNE